jgi:hypothetical protein
MNLQLNGAVLNPPSFLGDDEIAKCKTYREAVRLSWAHRRVKAMTQRTLAEYAGLYYQHVNDYIHSDDAPHRRNLPADKLNAWASVTGNWAVQQWLARQDNLTLMEEVISRRAA